MSMMVQVEQAILAMCAAMALAVGGCKDSGPRELPFPRLEARALFAGLSPDNPSAPTTGMSDFERQVRAASASSAVAAPSALDDPPTCLIGRFCTAVPGASRGWSVASEESASLIVHFRDDGKADAWVYLEAFSRLVDEYPSAELGRFVVTVAPELIGLVAPVDPRSEVNRERLDRPASDLAQALSLSRTLGMGIRFVGQPASFTGWKWVGKNAHGLELRLGQMSGRTAAPVVLSDAIREAIKALPGVEGSVLEAVGELVRSGGASSGTGGDEAHMILGNVCQSEETGLHVAMICEGANCPVARELAQVLDDMRYDLDARRKPGSDKALAMPMLAGKMGILFLPPEVVARFVEAIKAKAAGRAGSR